MENAMEEDADEDVVYDFRPSTEDEERIFNADLDFDVPKQQIASSSKYFTFNQASYQLMVDSILASRFPSAEEIMASDSEIVTRVLKNSLGKQNPTSAVRSRWKDIQDRLVAEIDPNGEGILRHRDSPGVRIPHRDQWEEIFHQAHVQDGRHLGWKQTLKTIQKEWCTNIRKYGIFDGFIQNSVYDCPGCDFSRVPIRKKKEEYKFSQRMTIAARDLPRTLEEIAVKYKVLLRIDRADRVSRNSEVKDYVCHRGRSKRGRKSDSKDGVRDRARDRKSCRIGCPFRVRVVIPIEFSDGSTFVKDEGLAHILLSPFHDGHRPGTKDDLLALPPHTSAIRCCENDFSKSGANLQALVRASANRASFLYSQATEGDQASYRFFLLPKDVEQLTYRIKSRESVSEDDWTALHLEAQALQAEGKVIFYQPCAPNHPDEAKRPFILVLQDAWMRESAKRFSVGSSWVVSCIFRDNQFGLPLYAGLVPNQAGEELPVFFMLCSVSQDECIAVKVALQEVFKWLWHTRPSAIVIERSMAELRAIQEAVDKDPYCWRENILGGDQVACNVLLCWSHVRREWMENLLPEHVPSKRREIYHALNNMMIATTESAFDMLLHAFNEKHKDEPGLCEYVNQNWGSRSCIWRRMWPKWGRMFEHGEIETTNFAERLWNYIKYTLLRGRSKCNILGLLSALVGSSAGVHGEVLVEHYKQKQALIDSGKVSPQVGLKPQKKLITGEYVLELYESDVTILEIDDEVALQFRMRSEILPDVYHAVSVQNSSCDCLELAPICKHLQGVRLIVEKYFSHLCALAPPLDEPLHSEVFSLQHANGSSAQIAQDDPLELHFDDSMELCGNDGGNLRALSLQCSELKTELRRLLAIASTFNSTETALVLHTVRALKQKLQAFDTLVERPPRTNHQLGRFR